MGRIVEIEVNPIRLDRNTAPHALAPDSARIAEHLDLAWHPGIIRRGPGICKMNMQVPGAAGTTGAIQSIFVAHQRNGSKFLIAAIVDGRVLMYPGDGSLLDGGLLPFCNELADLDTCCSGTEYGSQQNNGDDCGVPFGTPPGAPLNCPPCALGANSMVDQISATSSVVECCEQGLVNSGVTVPSSVP